MTLEDITKRLGGFLFLVIGSVGLIVLLVATAGPGGAAAYGTYYAPPATVVFILAIFLIIFIDAGASGLLGSRAWNIEAPRATPLSLAAFVVLFVIPFVGLAVLGLIWAAQVLMSGALSPRTETAAVAAVALTYAVIRIPIALHLVNGSELARALGIRSSGGPDPGESPGRYLARTLVGFAVGVLVLDALLILVNAVLAPGDMTFYPYAGASTPFAALLWIVGLFGLGTLITEAIRSRAIPRSPRAVLAAILLVPALVLDARIPLYPVVAGIAGGGWTVSVNGTPLRSAAATPFVARTSTSVALRSPVPTPAPDANLTGLIRWGELAVPAVNVSIVNNGVSRSAVTDLDGRYRAAVRSGTVAVSVDVRAISSATWFEAATPASMRVSAGSELAYPTIYMTRRITPSEPGAGATVAVPVTLRWQPQWQSLDAAVTYLVRVLDDGAIGSAAPSPAPQIAAVRIAGTSLPLSTLVPGHRYRWSVEAWVAQRGGGAELPIGRSGMTSFTTR